jgi:hypothetical protein
LGVRTGTGLAMKTIEAPPTMCKPICGKKSPDEAVRLMCGPLGGSAPPAAHAPEGLLEDLKPPIGRYSHRPICKMEDACGPLSNSHKILRSGSLSVLAGQCTPGLCACATQPESSRIFFQRNPFGMLSRDQSCFKKKFSGSQKLPVLVYFDCRYKVAHQTQHTARMNVSLLCRLTGCGTSAGVVDAVQHQYILLPGFNHDTNSVDS